MLPSILAEKSDYDSLSSYNSLEWSKEDKDESCVLYHHHHRHIHHLSVCQNYRCPTQTTTRKRPEQKQHRLPNHHQSFCATRYLTLSSPSLYTLSPTTNQHYHHEFRHRHHFCPSRRKALLFAITLSTILLLMTDLVVSSSLVSSSSSSSSEMLAISTSSPAHLLHSSAIENGIDPPKDIEMPTDSTTRNDGNVKEERKLEDRSDPSSPDHNPVGDVSLEEHPPFNGNVTPFFIVLGNVCNAPRAHAFHLHAHGQNVSFSIVEEEAKRWLSIDAHNFLVLRDKLETNKTETDLLVTILVKSIPPPDTDEEALIENQLRLRLSISSSFCPGSESKATTIVIVVLSVLSLILLALLSLTLIILRRRKPHIFTRNSSQVSPTLGEPDLFNGSARTLSSPNGIMSKNHLTLEPILKPKKSSLRSPNKSTSELPEVSVTPDSPSATTGSGGVTSDVMGKNENTLPLDTNGERNEDVNSSPRTDNEIEIAMNGLSPGGSDSESPERRKRSVVTFNETTQIIQIGKK